MQDQVEQILTGYLSTSSPTFVMGEGGGMRDAKIKGIPDAAYAIAALFECQPVDRVRAMAALVQSRLDGGGYPMPGYFSVPDNDGAYMVYCGLNGVFSCWRMHDKRECGDDCDHIRAVEMFKEAQDASEL